MFADIENPNKTLHVFMGGFDGGATRKGFLSAVRAGKSAGAKATQEEIAKIAKSLIRGQRTWESVNFYDHNGALVDFEEPDWKAMMRPAVRGAVDTDTNWVPSVWFPEFDM